MLSERKNKVEINEDLSDVVVATPSIKASIDSSKKL